MQKTTFFSQILQNSIFLEHDKIFQKDKNRLKKCFNKLLFCDVMAHVMKYEVFAGRVLFVYIQGRPYVRKRCILLIVSQLIDEGKFF